MQKYFLPVEYAVLRQTSSGWQIPTRTIWNHELVFVLEGALDITLAERRFRAMPGTLLYFRPEREHSLRTVDETPGYFCGIHFDAGEASLPLEEVSHWDSFRKFQPALEEIVRLWNRKGYLDDWAVDLAFSGLLLEVFREVETAAPSSRRQIGKAIDLIHQNPGRTFTVEELCRAAGMKKSYFIQNFQSITGQSPIQYSINLRLEHAKAILLNESIPVREVAFRCGFRDEFYFSRMFRRKFGVCPSKFRDHA